MSVCRWHAIKAYEGWKAQLHPFQTSAPDADVWQLDPFTLGKHPPAHWVFPEFGANALQETNPCSCCNLLVTLRLPRLHPSHSSAYLDGADVHTNTSTIKLKMFHIYTGTGCYEMSVICHTKTGPSSHDRVHALLNIYTSVCT
jgi:hypothetical protein